VGEKEQEQLIELCKKENALFLQIETYNPHLTSPKGEEQEQNTPSPLGEGWGEDYYKKFITPYTAVIDLEKTEEEILANMKPK